MKHNILRGLIVTAGMTQGYVARELGISENSLSKKINGLRPFKLNEVSKLCEMFNIKDPVPVFFDSLKIDE